MRRGRCGDDEYGSGSALASITADVTATREMLLTLLAPVTHPPASSSR